MSFYSRAVKFRIVALFCLGGVTFLALGIQFTAATQPAQTSAVVAAQPEVAASDSGGTVTLAPASAAYAGSVQELSFEMSESRSQHAARINRNLFLVTSIILSFLILCRLVLLWQITQNRQSTG